MQVKSTIVTLGGIVLVFGAVAWGAYRYQVERIQVLSMQAMLVNVAISQDAYYAKNGKFSAQWEPVLPGVARPASLETDLAPVAGRPDAYVFGFGQNTAAHRRGFEVVLQAQDDGQAGMITATRIGGGLFHYALQRSWPAGDTVCKPGKGMGAFCRKMVQNTDELELKNLTPVSTPAEQTTEKAEKAADSPAPAQK